MALAPTLTGFLDFLRAAGIVAAYLPDNDPVIATSYNVALAVVNPAIADLPLPGVDAAQPSLYATAVYNLATDRVINFANDVTDSDFFQNLRSGLSIGVFVPGVTASSGDSGTNQSRLNPEWMKMLTMRDLQTLKTPYGRAYMEIALDMGPSIWGIS